MSAPPAPADAGAPPPPPGGDAGAPPPPPGGDNSLAPPPAAPDNGPPTDNSVAPPPADTQYAEAPAPSSDKVHHYTVSKNDSLWKISGKSKIYGDSFQWPLLFIANRDQIKDPDLINPGQRLTVQRDANSDTVADAVKKAKDTPRFEPHAEPREKLPIDY